METKQESNKYTLYVGSPQDVPITDGVFSYYRKGYMLVFSQQVPEGKWGVVLPENESFLRTDERKWLTECKIIVNAREVKKHQEDYITLMDNFIDQLEKELKKEVKSED